MKEPARIIGLVIFFFVMGVMVGYNMRAQQNQPMRIIDTETISIIERS